MKKISFIILALLPYFSNAQNIDEGLIGFWSFNDATADDQSDNNFNGIVYGAYPTTDRHGNANQAQGFSNNEIEIGDIGLDLNESWSISFWYFANDGNSDASLIEISNDPELITIYAADIGLRFGSNGETGGVGSIPQANTWHYVTGIWDTQKLKLYLNGDFQYEVVPQGFNWKTSNSLSFGRSVSPNVKPLQGKLDDIRIYNRELTLPEIQILYSDISTDPAPNIALNIDEGIIGFWSFDDATANDQSGNNFNGTVYGAYPTTDRHGNTNQAQEFMNNEIVIGDIGLDLNGPWSFSFWYFANDGNSNSSLIEISNDPELITIFAADIGLRFGSNNETTGIGSIPEANTWHYVTGIWDTQRLKLYLNGDFQYEVVPTGFKWKTSNSLSFGKSVSPNVNPLQGKLDDIRIYNRELTLPEIQILFLDTGTTLVSNLCGQVLFCNGENIGIGTDEPDAKLTVKGDIHTQRVRVDLNGVLAPDFVFEEDYDLLTLEEVEKFIQSNRHLPEIPSALEMEAHGFELKDMNLKLLQKVEELTLHLIAQNDKITRLEKKMKEHELESNCNNQ